MTSGTPFRHHAPTRMQGRRDEHETEEDEDYCACQAVHRDQGQRHEQRHRERDENPLDTRSQIEIRGLGRCEMPMLFGVHVEEDADDERTDQRRRNTGQRYQERLLVTHHEYRSSRHGSP
jgi:hypothetical protein